MCNAYPNAFISISTKRTLDDGARGVGGGDNFNFETTFPINFDS